MSNAVKTYFLAPGWDLPVGSVHLGSVILDPSRPQRAFNSPHLAKIESTIHTSYKSNFTETVDSSKKRKIGLWAQFLEIFSLGSELSVQYDKDQVDKYFFKRMKTEWFLPSKDFIEKCVQTAEVVTFLEQMDYRKPVYMITGLKTVEGASVTTVRSNGRKFHGKLGFDGTRRRFRSRLDRRESMLRLSRIVCKENKDLILKEYTKGALFGAFEDQEVGSVDVYEVEQTWEQGEGNVSIVDEEEDEVCRCILPELPSR